MTVGAIASNDLYASGAQGRSRQRGGGVDALAAALGAGDLEGAKKALSALQRNLEVASSGRSSGSARTVALVGAADTLSQTLTSGDVTAAQTAFATLKQGLQDLGLRGHRGHGRPLASLVAAGLRGSTQAATDFKSLLTSLGSGDLTSAQTAFDSLMADLQQVQSGQTRVQSPKAAARADFAALGASLTAGDLAAAREAYARLQAEMAQLRQYRNVYAAGGTQQASAAASGTVVDATA